MQLPVPTLFSLALVGLTLAQPIRPQSKSVHLQRRSPNLINVKTNVEQLPPNLESATLVKRSPAPIEVDDQTWNTADGSEANVSDRLAVKDLMKRSYESDHSVGENTSLYPSMKTVKVSGLLEKRSPRWIEKDGYVKYIVGGPEREEKVLEGKVIAR
ncbi:MAG: hypothetical protein DHS80DRAFT_24854 [Piptocephalis tieghemiana]|nr:MAG: hypothetical protein DHS80DRAFT_24854 [Piptocephalis tieghemiana]